MERVIGIDLGTTNSCVAIVEDGGPVVIPNRGGYKTTPSMVAVTQAGKRLVGHIAKRQAITNAENTVSAAKRLIGRKWSSRQTEAARLMCSYRIVEGPHDDVRIELRGTQLSVPEVSSMILQEMKVIADDYMGTPIQKAVITVLAQGGMGVVYFARHRLIDKPVALKILRPELVHNREITARFLTEAQAASAIGSEHIVDITDYGELPDGATYIVMEYLDGYSLNQRMKRCEGGLLPLPAILSIAREIAEGLQRAHDANIVHRDLKPDNILLIRKGKREDFVKILDFGIAKVLTSQNQTTTAGRIFGTPHYMSPEQGRGDDLDHRTDIYSLGVILYEMVTGHVPFDGDNPLGILTQHMYVEAKSMSDHCAPERVTPALECVVARCLMKDPEHRYVSMAELDEDLRRLQHLEPPLAWDYFKQGSAPAPEYLRPILRLPSKQRRVSPFLVTGVMSTAALAGWVLVGSSSVAPPEEVVPVQEPTTAPTTSEPVMVVNLAAEPIDAHVYRGKEDLGSIPILIQLLPGQTELLTLKRAGYKPYHLKVDGSVDRYAIRMVPLPGPATNPPAPTVAAVAEAAPTRVVDLRTVSNRAQWSPVVSPGDGGVSEYLNELFRTEEQPSSPPQPQASVGASASVALPPQDMDPRFAPIPPGPPPDAPPGPRTLEEISPTPKSPNSTASASPLAPPGPPPVDER